MEKQLVDVACQTEDVTIIDIPRVAEVHEENKQMNSALQLSALAHTRHEEDDDATESTADPKFVTRPMDISVAEGDPVTFRCEIGGTLPIGSLISFINWIRISFYLIMD